MKKIGAGFAANGRIQREDSVPDEPNYADSYIPPKEALNSVWYPTGLLSGQPSRMRARDLDRDVGSRIAQADDQNVSLFKLTNIPINVGVQLPNMRVQIFCEGGQTGPLIVGHGDDYICCLESF